LPVNERESPQNESARVKKEPSVGLFDTQVNSSTWKARFPLLLSATETQKEIEMLLWQGALVNDGDSYGNTPLLYGTRAGDVAMVRVLLRGGADPNKTSAQVVLPLLMTPTSLKSQSSYANTGARK